MPPVINPRSVGASWGIRLAIMAGRVLPPGGVARTKLVWSRCDASSVVDPCTYKGPVLVCGTCWNRDRSAGEVFILGPLAVPVGLVCETCGGRDAAVQADTGVPPGYAEAMDRIAEWNATIDRRSERRKECITPFDWLPLWHPGASWQR